MTTDDAIEYFKGRAALAHALGIATESTYSWKTCPPELRQLQLEAVTGGALTAGPECDKYRVPARGPFPNGGEPAEPIEAKAA